MGFSIYVKFKLQKRRYSRQMYPSYLKDGTIYDYPYDFMSKFFSDQDNFYDDGSKYVAMSDDIGFYHTCNHSLITIIVSMDSSGFGGLESREEVRWISDSSLIDLAPKFWETTFEQFCAVMDIANGDKNAILVFELGE